MSAPQPHIPVLIDSIVSTCAPIGGVWLDGTFGAGGYARALLAAGASRVIGIDRDPDVLERAADWIGDYDDRLSLHQGRFGDLEAIMKDADAPLLDGVVFDIGVSSMQIDEADRGFSFMSDGPLDMRMEQDGPSAADIVNKASEAELADILFQYGEERASRRIAASIVAARKRGEIVSTLELTTIIEQVLPKTKPGQAHRATRSFQALRIAVNDELGELVRGLVGAEAVLKPGGFLAVVTFHSLEDRIVKRFMAARSGKGTSTNRFQPEAQVDAPQFEIVTRRAVTADATEISANPRARSAKLRVARRLEAPAGTTEPSRLGIPGIMKRRGT